MQKPQQISKNTKIETQISSIRTNIWALEMGHDFLSREDNQQIAAWNKEIADLYAEMGGA